MILYKIQHWFLKSQLLLLTSLPTGIYVQLYAEDTKHMFLKIPYYVIQNLTAKN